MDLDSFDRIREKSPKALNERIARDIEDRVRSYGSRGEQELSRQIAKLDREWDADRAMMLFFAGVGSLVWTLGMRRNRKWFYVMAVQLPFLAYHAVNGWCPPMALFRRLGFRSSKEIDAERYALKTLRGDFSRS